MNFKKSNYMLIASSKKKILESFRRDIKRKVFLILQGIAKTLSLNKFDVPPQSKLWSSQEKIKK